MVKLVCICKIYVCVDLVMISPDGLHFGYQTIWDSSMITVKSIIF